MNLSEQVANLLGKYFDEDDEIEFIDYMGDGRHFFLKIISDKFLDLSRLQRSRKVYSLINDLIARDIIHALQMELKTKHESEIN